MIIHNPRDQNVLLLNKKHLKDLKLKEIRKNELQGSSLPFLHLPKSRTQTYKDKKYAFTPSSREDIEDNLELR